MSFTRNYFSRLTESFSGLDQQGGQPDNHQSAREESDQDPCYADHVGSTRSSFEIDAFPIYNEISEIVTEPVDRQSSDEHPLYDDPYEPTQGPCGNPDAGAQSDNNSTIGTDFVIVCDAPETQDGDTFEIYSLPDPALALQTNCDVTNC